MFYCMRLAAFFQTKSGIIFQGDSLELMRETTPDSSVELIVTSPPFGLVRKKSYGNVDAEQNVSWRLSPMPRPKANNRSPLFASNDATRNLAE